MSVYVGIDVHRKRSQVAVVDTGGEVLANRNVPNGTEPILKVIGGLPPGAPAAFEAGFGTGWLVELLEDYGLTPHLVHPSRCKATYSSRSKVVRIRILLAGAAAVIAAVAWMPFMPGIRTSISTTSGCRAFVMLTPVAPSAASPATSMSGSASRIIRKPRRSRDWSSTSRTRIMGRRRRPGAAGRCASPWPPARCPAQPLVPGPRGNRGR